MHEGIREITAPVGNMYGWRSSSRHLAIATCFDFVKGEDTHRVEIDSLEKGLRQCETGYSKLRKKAPQYCDGSHKTT